MLNGAYNALSHVPDEEIPTILETLFDTAGHAIAPADIREHVATCIEDGRDHYYLALSRALGASPSPVVLDGSNATSLAKSIEQYISPDGLTFTGATDIGVHYPKSNEDRVSLRPDQGFAAVVDGLGGEDGSGPFADALALALGMHPGDIPAAIRTLQTLPKQNGISSGSACFAATRVRYVDGHFVMDAWRVGDCRIAVIDGRDGVPYYESRDQTRAQVIYDAERMRIANDANSPQADNDDLRRQLQLARDTFLNGKARNIVTDAIDANTQNAPNLLVHDKRLRPGSLVLLLSDGITDNVLLEEVLERMRRGSIPLSAETLLAMIDELTTARMRDYTRIQNNERKTGEPFCDGFAQKPKPDNRAFVCIEVPQEPVRAPAVSDENAAY